MLPQKIFCEVQTRREQVKIKTREQATTLPKGREPVINVTEVIKLLTKNLTVFRKLGRNIVNSYFISRRIINKQ